MRSYTLNKDVLFEIWKKKHYNKALDAYNNDLPVIFGIRGGLGVVSKGYGEKRVVEDKRMFSTNNTSMRCLIGCLYKGSINVFTASTVPNRKALLSASHVEGNGANQLELGLYTYKKGIHRYGAPSQHHAFRQPDGVKWPVRRSADDAEIEKTDKIYLAVAYDNLHASWSSNPEHGFSSNGCQVVLGRPSGSCEWMEFRGFVYKAMEANDIAEITYTLLDVSDFLQSSISPIIRFGSSGEFVSKVAHKMSLDKDEVDAEMFKAIMHFQEKNGLVVDGIIGPKTLESLNASK